MRADRLVATLLLMQARGRVTAAEVAAELEISVATARRDFEALSAAGIPVYPQSGRGGGWMLLGEGRTDLSGLNSSEAQALFLLLGPAASVAPDAQSALRKLVRALSASFRSDAEAAAEAIIVDPAAWGDRERSRPDAVERLQSAVVSRRVAEVDYANRAGEASTLIVEPWGLADKDDVWYLIAGVRGNDEPATRTLRVDRIRELRITDERFERPANFDLAAEWSKVVAIVESRRSLVDAVVLVDSALAFVLHDQFGRHSAADGLTPDGRARVRVSAPSALTIAQQLAGWGDAIDVVESDAVRAELARIGAELAARYR